MREAPLGSNPLPGAGSCTPTLRIMFRELSRPVCVMPSSRVSALGTCFQPLVQAFSPLSERTSAAQLHDHQPALLKLSAAVAMVARDITAPHGASTHGPSIRPPSLACTAATTWLSPCHWWARAQPVAVVNWHGASRNCSSSGTPPAADLNPPRPGTGY